MRVNPYIFRGYDIRGIAEEDLNPAIAEHIGKAHGTLLKKVGIAKAVVGRDCRATSPEYSAAIIRGLNWAGVDVIDIGMTLVGIFYWAQYFLDCRGGVYVTASHNPPQYNGFKLADDFSETLVSEGIQEIRRMVEAEDYIQGARPGALEQRDISESYFADMLKRFKIDKKFKVVVDPGHGTAGAIVPELFRRFGFEVIEKNCRVDSAFPMGTPDPVEKAVMERLAGEVLAAGADIGFTFDADGDRIGIADERGGIIWNDILVALFAADVLGHHPGATIMYNTLCSKVVADTIRRNGGRPFMWRVGHSFLKKKNQEVKAAFIGELAGHFFFSADFYNHDDGIYSTLRLLDYLNANGLPLSAAVKNLSAYVSSPEIKVYCADDKKVALMGRLAPILKKDFPEAEVIDDERAGDGVRLEMDDAMFVVRYSQNGPYLTVKFEGKTRERYEELKNYISVLLHQFAEIDWESKINVNIEALVA